MQLTYHIRDAWSATMKNLVLVILCSMIAGECVAEIRARNLFGGEIYSNGERFHVTIIDLISNDPNEIIYGIDTEFTGTMRQVHPLGMQTPFSDLNGFFGREDVRGDSQFLFHSQDFSTPPLRVTDTEHSLTAVITNLPGATNSNGRHVELARIVESGRDWVHYRLSIDVRDRFGTPVRNLVLTCGVYGCPEPGTVSLLTMAAFGLVGVRRRRVV